VFSQSRSQQIVDLAGSGCWEDPPRKPAWFLLCQRAVPSYKKMAIFPKNEERKREIFNESAQCSSPRKAKRLGER